MRGARSAPISSNVPTSIVIDAAAVVELITKSDRATAVQRVIEDASLVAAPDHLNGETLSALRRLEFRGLAENRAAQAVADLERLPVERVATLDLLQDAWMLRKNVTSFDACYVVLARRLRCPLLTADKRLAQAPNLGIPLIVV
jgi:predicted nucleic acid-binding protein